MSTVEANTEVASNPVPEVNDLELTAARDARVGTMAVRRLLPLRLRRSVGSWLAGDSSACAIPRPAVMRLS